MKIAIAQIDIAWRDKGKNFQKTHELAYLASNNNCDVLILPETFNTGFCFDESLIEEEGGETENFLMELSKKLKINILAGYLQRINGKNSNCVKVFSKDGKTVTSYAKIHLFSLLNEDKFCSAGNSPVTFQLQEFKCSVFICYDLRFPEVFRSVVPSAEVFFIVANWPASRLEHWSCLLKARAIENQCYVVGVNRVGVDGNGIQYAGKSAVYDPFGKAIVEGDNREGILFCELNKRELVKIRKKFPFLKDKREFLLK